jgi:TIR domain
MLSQTFISHTGQDRDAATFAGNLAERLRGIGITFFLDQPSLNGGDDWSNKIVDNAQHSSVMVVVLSESYFQRYWCMRELDLAISMMRHQHKQITIIPVYYGITDLGDMIKTQQSAWQETWDTFALASKEGVDVQRWLANLQWLDQHCQGIRRADKTKYSDVPLQQVVFEAVFKAMPPSLHEQFTVSLDDSSLQAQDLLLITPVLAIVGAGELSQPFILACCWRQNGNEMQDQRSATFNTS